MSESTNYVATLTGLANGTYAASAICPEGPDDGPCLVHLDELSSSLTAPDLESAADWVEALTELVSKARSWDEHQEALATARRQAAGSVLGDSHPEPDETIEVDKVVVYHLTDHEGDEVWVDRDGDHYRVIDGDWHMSVLGDEPWSPIGGGAFVGLLRNYGPYTALR